MTTLILVATETTESPLRCVVIAIKLKITINNTPRKTVPGSQEYDASLLQLIGSVYAAKPDAQAMI